MSVGCIEGCKTMHLHFKVLRNLTNKPHKRRLAKKQIAVLLVLPAKNGSTRQREGARGIIFSLPDLPQCLRARAPTMRPLDSATHWSSLACRLRG
jgi:hypothetical protein